MKIICVDDEELVLNLVVYLCSQLPDIDDVRGFTDSLEALDYLRENKADLAILDIDMPKLNGINLAVKIKGINPDTAIIFLTGYSHFAVEAFKLHAQGYLLKPVNKEQLIAEIKYALSPKVEKKYPHIFARTFGEFDFLVDSKPVCFQRSKSKELLAFLVDRNGAGVKRAVAFAALYEDAPYDRKMQKQFDVIIRSMKDTLKENGIEDIFDMKSGELRLKTEMFECDYYNLLSGDTDAINSFRGEYMNSYGWASITEADIAYRCQDALDF
jgi:two-component SAPR family response regulator